MERELEPVFLAASVREAALVEKLLDENGIAYDLTPEAFVRSAAGVCFQGLLFSVRAAEAGNLRRLLAERGLQQGLIDPHSP